MIKKQPKTTQNISMSGPISLQMV